MRHDAVNGIADGFLTRSEDGFFGFRNRNPVEWALKSRPRFPQQKGLRRSLVIRCPDVVHRNGRVQQVPGVHGGPSKIVADSLQHLFVPQVRDGLVLGQLGLSGRHQPNQLAEKQGQGTDGIHHLLISFVRPES